MPKQRITIEIEHGEKAEQEQVPYVFVEKNKKTGREYHALRHFFEDVGYEVTELSIKDVP